MSILKKEDEDFLEKFFTHIDEYSLDEGSIVIANSFGKNGPKHFLLKHKSVLENTLNKNQDKELSAAYLIVKSDYSTDIEDFTFAVYKGKDYLKEDPIWGVLYTRKYLGESRELVSISSPSLKNGAELLKPENIDIFMSKIVQKGMASLEKAEEFISACEDGVLHITSTQSHKIKTLRKNAWLGFKNNGFQGARDRIMETFVHASKSLISLDVLHKNGSGKIGEYDKQIAALERTKIQIEKKRTRALLRYVMEKNVLHHKDYIVLQKSIEQQSKNRHAWVNFAHRRV
ncbi:MAG: hypothetical protein ACTSXQ_06910 [Alphaproteobacteria bacterium]